jgi:ABC-type branched-subunit amino acid transport system ATPase component
MEAMTTPVIHVERLDLSYGDFHAVKDLTCEVRRASRLFRWEPHR